MAETRKNAWQVKELEQEPDESRRIIQEFWDKRVIDRNQNSIDELRNMLSMNDSVSLAIFDEAIQKNSVDKFLELASKIPPSIIRLIDGHENLGVLSTGMPEVKTRVSLQVKDYENLQAYAEEKNISASIAIGVSSEKMGDLEKISAGKDKFDVDAPLSIHSVGKVFTGILTLIMIRNGMLTTNDLKTNIFDQLDEIVKNKLPPAAIEHLKKITLHQAMIHMAGLGNHQSNANYLERYGKTISDAITLNNEFPSLPKMATVADFIPFAFPKDEKFKPGKIGIKDYSNTGILLVGLVVEHAYNKYRKDHPEKKLEPLDFNGIMKNYVTGKDAANMACFSDQKPNNAKFNANNQIDHHVVGSPAGGYWTTAEDLAKFGQWLYQKCSTDHIFKSLVEKYGEESHRDGVISHKGDVRSSSAYFSVSLQTGRVVSVLNAQRDNAAAEMGYAIKRNIFCDPSRNEHLLSKETEEKKTSSTLRTQSIFLEKQKDQDEIEDKSNKNEPNPFG